MDTELRKRYEALIAKVTRRADDFAALIEFMETKTALTLLLQYADNWCGFVVEER